MIFLILLALSFVAALIPKRDHALVAIFLIACTLPTSNAYSQVISFQGVYFYDAFTVGYIARLFFEFQPGERPKTKLEPMSILVILLHFVLISIALTYETIDKYFVKDIRPVLNVLFFVLVFDLYKKSTLVITDKLKERAFVMASAASFVKIILLVSGIYGFQDEYYEDNAFRYLDASSYFCVIYIISRFANAGSISGIRLIALVASVLSVLLANSRFILFSLGVAAAGISLNKPKRIIICLLAGTVLAAAFYFVSVELDASRVIDNLSIERITAQLDNRFGPALERIREFSGLNYLIGLGAGTTFEIPWFAYRGLETTHSNIDSAYLTYIAKYGAIGFLLLVGFAFAAIPKSNISKAARIFLFSMFIVSATPYQPYCIGLISSFLWVNRK